MIGLCMPMTPEIAVAFFAIIKIGAIVLPLFSAYGADAIATRLSDAGAAALDHRGRRAAERPHDPHEAGRRRRRATQCRR